MHGLPSKTKEKTKQNTKAHYLDNNVIHFQLKLDIEELKSFMQQAQRQKCRVLLGLEVRKLETELTKLVEADRPAVAKAVSCPTDSASKCYEVKLNNYGWDQSEKYVKLYVTLEKVNTLPEGAVYCNFTERSMDLRAMGLDNRNYQLPIHNLCEDIDTAKSYIKVKTNMVVVFLAKKVPKHWSHVTGVEKRIKEAKTAPSPDLDKGQDGEANLMNLMKKMYQDSDDDMKKIIAKAWTESQDKKTL